MDFETGFRVGGSLTGPVAFKDYSAVEEIFSDWEMQVFAGVFMEAKGFHGWEFVDCGEDFGSCERVSLPHA
jgi:hypothetical protein